MKIRREGAARIFTGVVLPFVISLIVLLVMPPAASAQRPSRRNTPAATSAEIRNRLAQPVAFEFKCEPLRNILRFITRITGVNIFVDEKIFEQYGEYEDCTGNPVDQLSIFVTTHVSQMSLESALHGMLRQHGLGFSIEDDHLFVTALSELSETAHRSSFLPKSPDARERLRKQLSQAVAFEFTCEPLRNVLRFIVTITGINIFVDENIFERFGQYEDCYRNPVYQPSIFVTTHVNKLPLESALHGMLRQYGLGFSIEGDHLFVTALSELSEAAHRSSFISKSPDGRESVRKQLSQAVAFEFTCEPLRDVLRFITYTSGLIIFVDENIFEQFGAEEDCEGNPLSRKDIFVTTQAKELPLESALNGMLRQYGLKFFIERDYVYVAAAEDVSKQRSRASAADEASEAKGSDDTLGKSQNAVRPKPVRWASIKVRSVFDPKLSGTYIAILEVDGQKRFVKEGEKFDDYEVLRIDGEKKCITVKKSNDAREKRFCVAR